MERKQLELIIDSNDDTVTKEIEESLGSIEVVRGRKARVLDPVTILAIAAGVVQLVNELLALQEKLKQRRQLPSVTVRNLRGDSVTLVDATREQLQALVEADSADEK